MKFCFIGIHSFEKWSKPYKRFFTYYGNPLSKKYGEKLYDDVEEWQTRTCKNCGLRQEKNIDK